MRYGVSALWPEGMRQLRSRSNVPVATMGEHFQRSFPGVLDSGTSSSKRTGHNQRLSRVRLHLGMHVLMT